MRNEQLENEQLPKQLGIAGEDPRDNRDHIYTGAPPEVLKVMPTIEQGYDVEDEIGKTPDFDQSPTWGCGPFGICNDLTHLFLAAIKKIIIFSKRWFYSHCVISGGKGVYIRDLYKLAHQKGVPEDRLMLTYKPDGTLTEEWLKYKGDITPEIIANAAKHKIGEYLKVPSDNFNLLLQGIFESKGVGCGIRGVDVANGHFFELVGFGMHNGYPAVIRKDSVPIYVNGKKVFRRWIVKIGDKYYQENSHGTQVILFSHWLAKKNFSKDMYDLKRNPDDNVKVYAFTKDGLAKRHVASPTTLVEGTKTPDQRWVWNKQMVIPIATREEWNKATEMAKISLGECQELSLLKLIIAAIRKLLGIK